MRPPAALAALALCLAACGHEEEPAARLAVEPREVVLGYPEAADVRLDWQPLSALGPRGGSPVVFVHLLDAPGEIVRTFDHAFPERWTEGVPASYPLRLYQSALAPPLPAGTYRLALGLYEGHGRTRWPLETPGLDLGRHEYQVADVVVPAPRPGGVHVELSSAWRPAERGGDRQILARRWLGRESGTLRITGLAGPGSLWMVLDVPRVDPGRLQVLDGSNAPSAVVRWTCGGMEETGVSGVGSHEIEMTAEEPPPEGTCEVTVTANFVVTLKESPGKRSVVLENLAWDPAGEAHGAEAHGAS